MTIDLKIGIVRILRLDGTTTGTGFVVTDEGLIATCAHVVANAGAGPGEAVHIIFHHTGDEATATVEPDGWRDPDTEDIAILRLEEPLPEGVTPLPLGYSRDVSGHRFKTFGFPKAGDIEGLWGYGTLGDPTTIAGQSVLQLTGATEVTPGFSGAPVWDETSQWVVGIVTAIIPPDAYGRLGETAFITPTEVLVEAWPTVLGQALLDADMDRLRARRDQADRRRREMRERQRVVNVRPLDVSHTFKDRLREMQDLCNHLAENRVRLVSVLGRGGMGKTALVSRVLADLEQGVLPVPGGETELPIDGILYLSARSTGLSLERIYADVARMLGEPAASRLEARWADHDTSLATKVEYLLESLMEGLYLVLLDNLEDYLSERGDIADEGLRLFLDRCLTQPSGTRIVVTSREQAKFAVEALAGARTIPLSEGLPEQEAMALLRELDPEGELGLRDAPEENLRRAVQLTRGIPRALELLAGILDRDPIASLTGLLDDKHLLRDQVVEQFVAEGHRRLEDEERRVMEALAIFDRPVEETAVAYLLHPWYPGLDVQTGLRRLVGGYFVSANRATGEYSLHPLDREYAYHKLPDLPEDGAGTDAYTRRNLELRAADFYASIRKPESEWKTIDDLTPQLAEFEHRVRAGDYDDACRMLALIDYNYLYLWGHSTKLTELRLKLQGRLSDLALQVANTAGLGRTYHILGQSEQAIKFYEMARTIACEIADRKVESNCLSRLGNIYRTLGQVRQAIKFHEEALVIARETGDRQGEGAYLGNLGSVYRDLGRFGKAIEFHKNALTIAREMDHGRSQGIWLSSLGLDHCALGQFEEAVKLFNEALLIFRDMDDQRSKLICLGRMGVAYRKLGRVDQAVSLFKQALDIAHQISYPLQESRQLLGLGEALLAAGELSGARQSCIDALKLDMPATNYRAALVLGIVLLYQHDPAAKETFADAAARCRVLPDHMLGLYDPSYALAGALAGQAVCDLRWTNEDERSELLALTLAEYQRALEICAAPGVVQDALLGLELIRAAGIKGLKPVFELLQGYANRPAGTIDVD